jgi:hypothetical protein
MKITRPGIWAAALLLASALGASALAASAAEPNCRAIESTSARLSCYNAAFPPKTRKPAENGVATSSGYRDPFLAEEARTAAKLEYLPRLLSFADRAGVSDHVRSNSEAQLNDERGC